MGKRKRRRQPEDQEQPKMNKRLFDKALERAQGGGGLRHLGGGGAPLLRKPETICPDSH